MVSPELIYIKFLNKVNKGNTRGDTAVDKERFVLIFNEVKNRWVERFIKTKDTILIDSLWEIVKTINLYNGGLPNLDIEGYIHLDGIPSTNIPIPLSEQYVDQIINLAAEEFERNFQNPNDLQIAKDRTRSQE